MHRLPDARSAFSLAELMVVLAIMGILSVLAAPSIVGLTSSGNMNAAVSGLSQLLSEARAYAMAHNTYVWVGFYQDTSPQELIVVVVAGKTGQSTDLASASTYEIIAKPRTFSEESIQQVASLPPIAGTEPGDDVFLSSSASATTTFTELVNQNMVTLADILQFNSEGAATAINSTTGASHWVQIGLESLHANVPNSTNIAVLQVASLTGLVRVFRP